MKPKKSLGQNFLKDAKVLAQIVSASNLSADDFVLEVGPGEGALSTELIKKAGGLIMIEKDERLAKKLAHKLQTSNYKYQINSKCQNYKFQNKHLIISGDILEINLPELLEQNNFTNYKVVANIPYYITSPIIRLFLETKFPPTEMILMVQREVAERICASAGKLSILALSVQYYATPELLFTVPRTAFFPAPEVDSAVIRITKNLPTPRLRQASKKSVSSEQEVKNKKKDPAYAKASADEAKKFFRIVKAGFSAKRKTLLNNLATSLQLEKSLVEEKLKNIGILPNQRAQELSLEDWKKLVKLI